jgi:hypothetical protein
MEEYVQQRGSEAYVITEADIVMGDTVVTNKKNCKYIEPEEPLHLLASYFREVWYD